MDHKLINHPISELIYIMSHYAYRIAINFSSAMQRADFEDNMTKFYYCFTPYFNINLTIGYSSS